ncbi:hypothetical protein BDEG_24097 [Batrachochytrium dendrobatidis JEL423]|uniref:Uncharacterized protein n=1 Tax=Batrachochytrium dendrobatidis (strain JEL423) TaxID=403673 RepID=A0A177WKL2_BATDL|nr:hypothetical protein BDEG_24097 [Batrachochytrium dendrobatidis JEL423]
MYSVTWNGKMVLQEDYRKLQRKQIFKNDKTWVKFKPNNATRVSTEDCEIVDDLLKACKKELSPHFDSYAIDQLSLSTTDGGTPLQPDDPIPAQNTAKTPLFITVADSSLGSRSLSKSSLKAPHPKRKERWEQLNEILEKNKRKSKATDSTAYSYVSWNQVKDVLRTTPYIQSSKAIPDTQFNILTQYLSFATKCFGSVISFMGPQRLHLIAPIIICVCFLFNGDVQIEVEEDLNGDFLKAHGHFEFVLRRGKKRVYIVEAKKEDMDQGMTQNLIGCEVAAEIGHLDSVYGIVTNYAQWSFLRSLDEKIEMDECSIKLLPGGEPSTDSLVDITGKIYAMLSDE